MLMFLKETNELKTGEMVLKYKLDNGKKVIVLTDKTFTDEGLLNIEPYYYEEVEGNLYLTELDYKDLPSVQIALDRVKEGING